MTLTAKRVVSKAEGDTDIWFESVFKEHWHRVYGVLYWLLGDPSEAQDLALEVFWRLHRRPPRLDDELSLDGWLYRVATNQGLNALRSRQRRQRYEEEAGRMRANWRRRLMKPPTRTSPTRHTYSVAPPLFKHPAH